MIMFNQKGEPVEISDHTGEERTRVDITLVNGETTTYTEYRPLKSVCDDIVWNIGETGCVILNVLNESEIINFAHVSKISLCGYQVSEW
jgi:hypothetical protein